MKRRQEELCSYTGQRSPWLRRLRRQTPEAEHDEASAAPMTDRDIEWVKGYTDSTLELFIRSKCSLTLGQITALFTAHNTGKKRKDHTKYYAFLEHLRDEVCIPAMQSVLANEFPTLREAVRARLKARGLERDV